MVTVGAVLIIWRLNDDTLVTVRAVLVTGRPSDVAMVPVG